MALRRTIETKEELLAYLESVVLERVLNWTDFYSLIEDMYKNSKRSPDAFIELFLSMYSFLLAMKELPDEGDIVVLVKKALHMLVFENEKFGIDLHLDRSRSLNEQTDAVEVRLATDLQSLSLAKNVLSRIAKRAIDNE